MSELYLQIAIDAIPDLVTSQVRRLCRDIGRDRHLVGRLRWKEVALTRRYLTAQFTTQDVDGLWTQIQKRILDDPACEPIVGHLLVIATGQRGWADSRSLYPPTRQVA